MPTKIEITLDANQYRRELDSQLDRRDESGGGTLILAEGFKSRVEIGNHFRNIRIQRMKEAAMANQKFSGIPEAAQMN